MLALSIEFTRFVYESTAPNTQLLCRYSFVLTERVGMYFNFIQLKFHEITILLWAFIKERAIFNIAEADISSLNHNSGYKLPI